MVKPKLSTPFPNEVEFWTCPKTGLIVPKRQAANIQYREDVLRAAQNDMMLQKDLMRACTDSCLYWINMFVWTKHEFIVDIETGKRRPAEQTHVPFITWKIQDELLGWIEDHFNNGESGLIDKSRDMGASWGGISFLHWLWLFRPETQIREMSRSEIYVDSPITKSLFFKHDYINKWLPLWMRPPGIIKKGRDNRTSMRIQNELNGSTIAGESTTKHAMSADRCAILFLDEFAKVDNGEDIRTATFDAAVCRIVNSTVAGPGTAYSLWKNSGQIDVFPLMFWDHPQKGYNRFVVQDDATKMFQISSPWLEKVKLECSEKAIAQEQYAIDLEAGDTFFDLKELGKHIALFAEKEFASFNIMLKENIPDANICKIVRARDIRSYSIKSSPDGNLSIWTNLIDGRPDQSKTYIFGIDTSKGQGASDSVVSIKCKQTGEKIAMWRSNTESIHDFARTIIALSLWCGGANPQRLPFLKWEKNGPGWELGRLLVQIFMYPYYYRTKTVGAVVEKVAGAKAGVQKYGYHMSREGKQLLLSEYERALKCGAMVNHCKESLEQAKLYIYFQDGSIGPAELTNATQAEKKQHGDMVIADALTVEDDEVYNPEKRNIKAPCNSFAWRKERYLRKKKCRAKNKRNWRRPYNYI